MEMPPRPAPDGVVAVGRSILPAPPRRSKVGAVSDQAAMESGAIPEGVASASFIWRGGRGRGRAAVWIL
jgi:hypothetical protein